MVTHRRAFRKCEPIVGEAGVRRSPILGRNHKTLAVLLLRDSAFWLARAESRKQVALLERIELVAREQRLFRRFTFRFSTSLFRGFHFRVQDLFLGLCCFAKWLRRRDTTAGRAHINMDHIVKNLENAYLNLVTAASNVLEAKEVSDFERSKNSDDALERFYNTLQLFHAACDQTQEFVEYLRLRIGSECLVDEATGPLTAKISKPGQDGAENRVAIPSLSALRLEQMSKAVRWLVIELQQGAASATPRPDDTSGALDIRPEDDAHQHLSGLFHKDTPLPSLAETTRFLGGENTDEWASTAEAYTLSEVTATVGCSSFTVAQHILIADDNTPAAAGWLWSIALATFTALFSYEYDFKDIPFFCSGL